MYYVGLFTDRPARSTAMPVLFHSVVQNFGVFRPAGATCCPDKREIWHGAKMWEYSPKTVKISNFGQKFLPQGRLGCNIFTKFSAFVRVYS